MADVTTKNLASEVAKTKDAVGAALVTVTTTAALAAKANAINTTGKYVGKLVYNSDTKIVSAATGTTDVAVWANVGSGATTHTPA